MALKGIDVSKWNGDIDWKKVKAAGIQFAIIKAGGADDGLYKDSKFEQNYEGAKAAGIPIGAYFFNSAEFTNESKALEEARYFESLLKGKQFEWPVFCDIEAQDYKQKKGITEATIAFCEYLETAGYWVGIYGSDIAGFSDRLVYEATSPYTRWIARYSGSMIHKSYAIHQYSSTGKVNGISGNVDMNESYVDFEPLIKEKMLNGWTAKDKSKFTPRLTRPTAGNKYYITSGAGGWAPCIKGSPTDKDCNVLSNCVGYAVGRFNEIGGYGYCKYAKSTNAENFIEACKAQGLEVGSEPKLGAIAVWQKGATLSGSDGAGHVAVVEQINSDGSIVTSESGWNCDPFWTKKRIRNYNWGAGSGYTFRGFIYQPTEIEAEISGNKTEPSTGSNAPSEAVSALVSESLSASKQVIGATAKAFTGDLAGSYKVNASGGLNLRIDAGTDKTVMVLLTNDLKVRCFGCYTENNGVKWLQVQAAIDGTLWTGFCSSQYLKKL